MDLKQAIIEGGAQWQVTYPAICAAAAILLEEEKVSLAGAYSTREVADALLAKAGLSELAPYRRNIYRAITNATQAGRPMGPYHSRRSEPDPARPGMTRLAYFWHLPDPKALIERMEAEKQELMVRVEGINVRIHEQIIQLETNT